MRELSDRVAVVTGAASGIGRALAERLASERMKVALPVSPEVIAMPIGRSAAKAKAPEVP